MEIAGENEDANQMEKYNKCLRPDDSNDDYDGVHAYDDDDDIKNTYKDRDDDVNDNYQR